MKTVEAIRQGKRGILIQMPCRSGKSFLMAEMIKNLKGYGLVLVHRKELMKQHKALLNELSITNARVASVFTEANHLDEREKPSVIFIDECHLSEASSYKKVCNHYKVLVVGFTATPTRLNGDRLSLFDCIVQGITANELMKRGAISNYDYYAPNIGIDTSDMAIVRGDYRTSELQDLFTKNCVYGDIFKYYKELADGKQAIAYCVSIEHSKKVRDLFIANGVSAVHLDSHTPSNEREKVMNDFKQGKFKILCNVGLISEGITVPDCECCLLLRPTMSLALYIQQSMRCLTPKEGKKAVIIDYVGNFQRHGLPTSDREWSLDGAKKRKMINDDGSFSIRTCPQCFKVFKTADKCPYCGYEYEVKGRELKQMENSMLTGTIGYLGHDPELFDDSIKNNILMGENENAETYLKAVCFDKEVTEMEQGIDTVVGNGGVRLSGGQAKRLALARTLCHKRPVLILDDPFSALDRNTEREVYDNLKAMASDSIVILLSHRLYLFPEMDQVIWMEHGHAAVGTHEEIMEKYPEYAKLYEEQTKSSTAEKVNAGKENLPAEKTYQTQKAVTQRNKLKQNNAGKKGGGQNA